MNTFRKDFPILSESIDGNRLVYLDNASTAQKPNVVIEAIKKHYTSSNANINRGIHTLGERATNAYEQARKAVTAFINAPSPQNIIFVRNTTEALNTFAHGWGEEHLKPEDEIIVSVSEHHSNFLPWTSLSKRIGCILHIVPIDTNGFIEIKAFKKLLNKKTKIVALTHMSNVLGVEQPIRELVALAHEIGAKIIVDGAQSIVHSPVDVQELDVDAYAFSAHKLYGPMGIGVLYAKANLLEEMMPVNPGGGTVLKVGKDDIRWNTIPERFEGGTPNVAGAVGLTSAIQYVKQIGFSAIIQIERALTEKTLKELSSLSFVTIYGMKEYTDKRGPVISFNLKDIHPHDIASILNEDGVAIRAGHHCAQPLMKHLGVSATLRASFSLYNTLDDIDALIAGLARAKKIFS